MYYWFYKIEVDETDPMFYWISLFFKDHSFSYEAVFQFHIIVITLLNYILIKKYTRNYFYVIIVYLVINYVHSVNQIRYFLGFPFLLLGFYYLFQRKNIVISITLFILAYLCHSALSVLLVFIPLYYFIPVRRYMTYITLGTLGASVILYLLIKFGFAVEIEHFGAYFGKEYDSSFLGGLFNALPYIIYYAYLIIESRSILKEYPEYYDDKKFAYLYKISFFPLIFVPASFAIQILGHRYVMPFVIFWTIYYLYLIHDLPNKTKSIKLIVFSLIHIVVACVFYVLPDFILKDNHYAEELQDIIKSIKYLNDYFF